MGHDIGESLLSDRESSIDGYIENGSPVPTHSELGMEGFFNKVQEIDKQFEKLSKILSKLQDANEESKTVTKASAMKKIKHRMEKDIDGVLKIALKTKTKLKELERDNSANRQKPGCGMGSAVDRSREATTKSLKEKLKERITEFQFLRETISKEYREAVERIFFTVTGHQADEEAINQLIESGNSEQILQKAILVQGQDQITDALAEIQERHDAVRDLEKKLLELQQIFFDMEVFVDAQGDVLNSIESQVSGAADYIQSGTTAFLGVKNLRNNSRKWIYISIIILLIVVTVAAAIVIAILRPWNNSS